MQNQNKKIIRWILGGALVCVLLLLVSVLIAKTISGNNPETREIYFNVMCIVTMFVYVIFCVIGVVRYNKYAEKYKSEKVEKARKELTTEFKQVLLNYSEPIPKDLFQCKAKIGEDGKIVCKIQLDYEVELEDYEKFLRFFHFDQE